MVPRLLEGTSLPPTLLPLSSVPERAAASASRARVSQAVLAACKRTMVGDTVSTRYCRQFYSERLAFLRLPGIVEAPSSVAPPPPLQASRRVAVPTPTSLVRAVPLCAAASLLLSLLDQCVPCSLDVRRRINAFCVSGPLFKKDHAHNTQ